MLRVLIITVTLLAVCQAKKRGVKAGEIKRADDSTEIMPIEELCEKHECPEWREMNREGDGFSTRLYLGAYWVGTDIEDVNNADKSSKAAFRKLFKYINGENDQSKKIKMTMPVFNLWQLNKKYEPTTGRMYFYIPTELQDNVPNPNDSSIKIEYLEEQVTYSLAFGGNVQSKEKYAKYAKQLVKAMHRSEIIPNMEYMMTVTYTRPGAGKQRYEVMFVGRSDEQ